MVRHRERDLSTKSVRPDVVWILSQSDPTLAYVLSTFDYRSFMIISVPLPAISHPPPAAKDLLQRGSLQGKDHNVTLMGHV